VVTGARCANARVLRRRAGKVRLSTRGCCLTDSISRIVSNELAAPSGRYNPALLGQASHLIKRRGHARTTSEIAAFIEAHVRASHATAVRRLLRSGGLQRAQGTAALLKMRRGVKEETWPSAGPVAAISGAAFRGFSGSFRHESMRSRTVSGVVHSGD
jgi:hypothetical protein